MCRALKKEAAPLRRKKCGAARFSPFFKAALLNTTAFGMDTKRQERARAPGMRSLPRRVSGRLRHGGVRQAALHLPAAPLHPGKEPLPGARLPGLSSFS